MSWLRLIPVLVTLTLLSQQLNLDQARCHKLIYSIFITRMGPESGQVPIFARGNSHRVFTTVSNAGFYVPTISSVPRLLLASLICILTWVRYALIYAFSMPCVGNDPDI